MTDLCSGAGGERCGHNLLFATLQSGCANRFPTARRRLVALYNKTVPHEHGCAESRAP